MSGKNPDPARSAPGDPDIAARQAVFARFELEDLQHLGGEDLVAAQRLCGHGTTLGYWETDLASLAKFFRKIDLAQRIRSALTNLNGEVDEEAYADLIPEAVQILTRLGLLMRLAATGGRRAQKNKPLKPSTVSSLCHTRWPKIIAHAIQRKARADTSRPGLFCHLNDADCQAFAADPSLNLEINRLHTLADKGLWTDVPKRKLLSSVTDPSSKPPPRKPDHKHVSYTPLPLDWLAEISPRVCWVVTELAPNLLRLLEGLRDPLRQTGRRNNRASEKAKAIILTELARNPWLDTAGRPLVPPFRFQTTSGSNGSDRFRWPICTWEHVQLLSTTVQAAHAFVALLAGC